MTRTAPTPAQPDLETDVLVVGAGPTGLALATTLARAGVDHVVVDRLDAGQNSSRAAVIHAHTLDELESIGVASRLMREGLLLDRFSIRDRASTLVQLRFDALPSRHPVLLMLSQADTERILRDALHGAGGMVRWSTRVEGIARTAHGAEACLVTDAGRSRLRARYVVGGDGMHSIVRETAGIGFDGAAHEASFVLADVDLDWSHGSAEVMLFFSPEGLLVVAPLPGGRFRLVAPVLDAPREPDVAHVQALVDARGPARDAGRVLRVHWSSRFRVHHRLAARYREGPLFLMGDAAHVHSPAGGQGMNTGLVDACVLGRLLADVVQGRRAPAALDAYESMRRPAAKEVLQLAGRLTSMAMLRGALPRRLRNLALHGLGSLPAFRHRLAMNLSGLSRAGAARLDDAREPGQGGPLAATVAAARRLA